MNQVARSRAAPVTAALFTLLFVILAGDASAQVVPPPDTLRVDTLRADPEAADTLPEEPPAVRLVRFPVMPAGPAASAAGGEWVWDRNALLREGATSLPDLLARIPAVATFRAGMFVQPEAAAAFGGTAGRLEIEVDGFVLDPLAAPSYDLSQIPLGNIRELRVQRRLGLLRIRILTEQPEHAEPYSRVEAGVGQPPANLFRGLFLVPHVAVGPLGLGIERLDTDGSGRQEPASLFTGWGKWAWTDGQRGLQVELMRGTLRREPRSPWPVESVRQDIIIRARNSFTADWTAELFAGRSVLEETVPRATGDTLPARRLDRNAVQAGVRTAYRLPVGRVGASLRYRNADFLPRTEASIDVDAAAGPARLTAELSRAAWEGHDPATYYSVYAELGRVAGAAAFVELTGGRRGAPGLPVFEVPAPEDTTVLPGAAAATHNAGATMSERSGWRAGITMQLGARASGTFAVIDMDQDMARPFGLPFDSAAAPNPADAARGFEAHGRVVLWPGYFALESWITEWREAAGWTYTPARSWRTALVLHTSPLESGNLEVLGRLEAAHRSGILVYLPAPPLDDEPPIVPLPGYTRFDGYLQIRVIDVRAFIRWEDLFGQELEELPGRIHRGPRIFYGVKWNLWN
jgi:hypothetical protein